MDQEPQRVATVLDDPGSRAVARGYVDAYLSAAADSGVDAGEAVADLRTLVDDVLMPNPAVAELLLSGGLGRADRLALIDRAIAPRVSPVLGNLLRVLSEHERMGLLPLVAREAGVRYDEQCGRQRVKVVASHPVNEGRREHIQRSLDAALPFEPILDIEIDPSLQGGLQIQVGDKVYDASLRTRLEQLRERLVARRVGT